MNSTATKESHEERTAHEPRDMTLHSVILADVAPVGRLVRVFRLQIPAGQPDVKFLPGQWVDLFVPGIAKAGGFTITSTPSQAVTRPGKSLPDDHRYIELAVKASPDNPAAAWLWQDPVVSAIVGQTLRLRAGGSFVFPPPAAAVFDIEAFPPPRFVFVAGGVGINPLVSMVGHLAERNEARGGTGGTTVGPDVTFLYSVREEPGEEAKILFLPRLAALFGRGSVAGQLRLFLTGGSDSSTPSASSATTIPAGVSCERRRLTTADVDAAVLAGPVDNVYVYVCGVPTMTDALVAHLTDSKDSGGLGLAAHQVLYERWW